MISLMATDNFYDTNLNPRNVRKGQVFEVNDEVQAEDFKHLAVRYTGPEKPVAPAPTVPAGTVTGVERKVREAPLNKVNPAPRNQANPEPVNKAS